MRSAHVVVLWIHGLVDHLNHLTLCLNSVLAYMSYHEGTPLPVDEGQFGVGSAGANHLDNCEVGRLKALFGRGSLVRSLYSVPFLVSGHKRLGTAHMGTS